MFVEQGYYFYNHLNSLGSLQMTQSHLGQEWSFLCCYPTNTGFPGGFSGKELACQCRRWTRPEFDPRDRKSPGGRPGNPLQYIFLENPMDRGAWRTTVHRVTKSRTQLKWFSMQHASYKHILTNPTNTYLLDFQKFGSQFWVLRTSRSVKQVLHRQLWSGSREWLDFRNTKLSTYQWLLFYPLDDNSAHGNKCSIPFICSRFLLRLTPTFLCIFLILQDKNI